MTCQQHIQTCTTVEKEAIEKEVKDQFTQLVAALNQKDAGAWSEFYSQDGFLSAIAGVDHYAPRNAWVDLVTNYFAMRARQQVTPIEVRVAALAPNLALMTSEEIGEMWLKTGEHSKSKHVFTMIWKKEPSGWRILHSHESWVDGPVS